MSNILALTKVLIKNNVFAFSGAKKKGKSVSTKGSIIGFTIAIVFCVACLGLPAIFALDTLLKQYNLSELILTFVMPIGGITSLIFGSFSVISIFYFSKDSVHLLPLPIKSSELLISKFLASLISEYLILFMFIFPLVFGVGIGIDAGILYYLYSIIICLLMPIIPSVIVSIVLMLLNKIFNFSRKKDLFMYIITGIIFLFSFAYSFGLEFILGTEDNALLTFVNGDMSNYLRLGKWLFPFFNSATYSLLNYTEFIGLASFVTYIGLNLLSMVVLYFIGDKLYIKGLTNNRGTTRKKQKLNKVYTANSGGIMFHLLKREWLLVKRTPIFMLNVVISNFIFPLIFIVAFIGTLSSGGKEIFEVISSMIDFNNSGILLIFVAGLVLMSSMSTAASTAISREGKTAKFMKMIPVSLKKQLDVKVWFAMIIDLITLLGIEIPLMIAIRAPWYFWVMSNVLVILLLFIINYISLLVDLRKPRLDWMEESEAVKQNFNAFWSIMISIVISGCVALLGVLAYEYTLNIFLIFAFSGVILLGLYLMISYFISKYQNKLFNKVV